MRQLNVLLLEISKQTATRHFQSYRVPSTVLFGTPNRILLLLLLLLLSPVDCNSCT